MRICVRFNDTYSLLGLVFNLFYLIKNIDMEIIGKFENKLVIKCDGGYHYEWNTFGTSSGCFFCEHEKGATYFDYLEFDKLIEVVDINIINEITLKRPKQIKY